MPQHRIIVVGEALVRPERVGDLRQRLAEVGRERLLVGDIVGHLPQPVHVVAERNESRRCAARQLLVGVADEGRARDFVEGADVRQARGAVAGFEDHRLPVGSLWRLALGPALQQLARFLVRPRLRGLCGSLKRLGVQIRCSSVLVKPRSWGWPLLCRFPRSTQPTPASGSRTSPGTRARRAGVKRSHAPRKRRTSS